MKIESGECGCGPSKDPLKGYDEALAQLLAAANPVTGTQTLPLEQALNRILTQPVSSRIDVPGWDNSAMDGYAVNSADLTAPGVRLPISQRIPAGLRGEPLQRGTAARIFTGAPIPEGADTVVIQEVCCEADGQVSINQPPKPGANVRRAGEDIRADSCIIEAGVRLLPQHLGLAASVGVAELEVFRPLKVALLASGDELVMPGRPLGPGQIYNSNQFTASGLLQALGCELIPLGIVADTLEATRAALLQAAEGADLILSSGGVSVGEEDHVKPAVEQLGTLDLWKIAIRPGKPLAFGWIGQGEGRTPFIGVPGNPVSLFVTFLLFARPFIKKMQGASDCLPRPIEVIADFDWPRPDKRREFARGRLSLDEQGQARVQVFPSRSSGVLSSVTWANGLVEIAEGQCIQRGDPVRFLSFAELLA
ncbi:molybdopterin molybdotransferase MoeA [Magnetovirga frankeli]|uniref:molybdopterin molybdotransferase MoeA n=1 Tax=Magnetovirga frankeli TaxID=947516 RepID=UPI0012938186|nr:molybdopterin molybdotransferase MoeA [gamma proteobacterium SS-5]